MIMTEFLRETDIFIYLFLNNSSSYIHIYFPTPKLAFLLKLKWEF